MEVDASCVGHNLYETRYGGIRTVWALIRDYREAKPLTRDRAFRLVYARYAQAIYGYVRRCYPRLPIADAQDVAAEVLAVLSGPGGLDSYDPAEGQFRPWLRTLIRHRVNNLIKYLHRRRRDRRCTVAFEDLEASVESNLVGDTDPLDYLDAQLVLATVNVAVNNVREVFRTRGKLARFDALRIYLPGVNRSSPPHAEMAQRLGITVDAVKAEVYRLKKQVRAQLIMLVRASLPGENDEAIKREVASMADILMRHFSRRFGHGVER